MKRIFVLIAALAFASNLTSPLFGQTPWSFKGFGVKAGMVDPENLDATVGLGAFIDFGPPNLSIEGHFDYWGKTIDESFSFPVGTLDDFSYEFTVRDFIFGGTAKYIFPTGNAKLSPFAGGGLDVHILQSKTKIPTLGFDFAQEIQESSETDSKIGFRLVGGLAYGLGPNVDGLLEFRYSIVENFNSIALLLGIVFK